MVKYFILRTCKATAGGEYFIAAKGKRSWRKKRHLKRLWEGAVVLELDTTLRMKK